MAEAELTTIARPYARAIFRTAVEHNCLERWSSILTTLSTVARDPRVSSRLGDPSLTHKGRADLLVSLCGDEIDQQAQNLVAVLAEYQRITLLPEIRTLFELLKANHEKTVEVEVVSAFEVTDEQSARLADMLRAKLNREVRIEARVDQSLIGGVVIRTEDSVIDNSVRGKLGRLSHLMNT